VQDQVIYYVERPVAFGPEWGLELGVSPVVKNPIVRN
jgi:hypothetical protein